MLNKSSKTRGVCAFDVRVYETETTDSGAAMSRKSSIVLKNQPHNGYHVRRSKVDKQVVLGNKVINVRSFTVKPKNTI